jgi:hypothetical protein
MVWRVKGLEIKRMANHPGAQYIRRLKWSRVQGVRSRELE